ncbi:MAG TPA: type IV secretion system protein VirB10 [Steroidobacteraceae bacterium]|nr:type IV secretion system protein VirB10 [Steroidobacteraceae bacterium]
MSATRESSHMPDDPGLREQDASEDPEDLVSGSVEGERGEATVNRMRSLQSRVSNLLAAGLMGALGLGALSWYYAHILTRHSHAIEVARHAARTQASGDAPLPPLGSFKLPTPVAPPAKASAPATPGAMIAGTLFGPPPPLPSPAAMAAWNQADALTRLAAAQQVGGYRRPAGTQASPFGEQLGGAVFAESSGPGAADGGSPAPVSTGEGAAPPWDQSQGAPTRGAPQGAGDALSALLRPTVTPTVEASVLPDLRFLLPQGAFIDCTLETAIDSTLPGMTTCVTATDTLSADGTVVLLERGTKLVGETRGEVRQGEKRLFVLWIEARTPTGVIVPLDSPGTDSLGRSGLTGKVHTHFWERFGAAILISVIDAGVQAGVEATSTNGAVIVNPSASEDVMTGVLKSTVDIPPTITVRQGSRIEVLVARDVDFRSVYRLTLTQPTSFTGGGR